MSNQKEEAFTEMHFTNSFMFDIAVLYDESNKYELVPAVSIRGTWLFIPVPPVFAETAAILNTSGERAFAKAKWSEQ